MTTYDTQRYLSLTDSAFHALVAQNDPVWQGLKNIGAWLKAAPELGLIEGDISPHAYLEAPELIYIAKGAVVESGALIRGPAWIGEGVVVRHGAYLRGNVLADKGAVIGHDTEVKNAVFLAGAQAGHFAYVGDAILGVKVNLGAGVKLANLKLSRREVFVDGVATGLKKFGAIIGDGAQVGCNAVLNPGTLIGRNVLVEPLVAVGGVIPEGSYVSSNLSIVVSSKR